MRDEVATGGEVIGSETVGDAVVPGASVGIGVAGKKIDRRYQSVGLFEFS